MAEYRHSRSKLQLLPGMPEDFANMDDLYVDLTLSEEQKTPTKVSQRTLTSHSELLNLEDNNGFGIKRILVRGGPGGGKSTLVSKMALDWACEKPDEGFKLYDLLFALDLRAVEKGMSVMDAIRDQLLPEIPKSCIEANAKSTAILLDGFDEGANVLQHSEWQDLFKNKWLQESLVIVTTRPHKIADFNKFGVYPLVIIEGFSFSHVKKYVDRFFKSTADHVDEPKQKAKLLVERIRESSLFNALSQIPIMLTMICLLWTAKEDMPQTATSLYQEALLFLATHKEAKYKEENDPVDDDVLEKRVNELILNVGEVALNGIFEERLIFKASEFESNLDKLCHLGIISKERARSRLRPVQHVSFLHKTFQEMCAGMYWASLADEHRERFQDILNRVHASNYYGMEIMLRFACATSTTAAELIIPRISALSHSLMIDCLKQQDMDKYVARYKFKSSQCGIGSVESDPWYLPLILLHESQVGDLCKSLVQLFQIENIDINIFKDDELLNSLNFFLASYLSMSAVDIDCNQTKHVKVELYSCSNLCLQMLSSVLQFMRNIESVTIRVNMCEFSWDTVKSFAMHRCILDGIGRLHALKNVDFTGSASRHISGILELFCRCEQITKNIKQVRLRLLKESIQHACNLLQQATSLRSLDLTCFRRLDLNNDDLSQIFGAVSSTKFTSISISSNGDLQLPISLLQPFLFNLQQINLCACLDSSNFQEMCLQIKMHVCHLKSEGECSRFLPYQELTLEDIPITEDAAETFAYISTFMRDLRLLTLRLSLHVLGESVVIKTIAKSLHQLTNLQSLDLSETKICDAVVDLCNSLKSLSNLSKLLLANASLEESHLSLIGKTLQYLPALRTLDLSNNRIGPAMHEICEGLQHCRIKHLVLHDTCIDDAGLYQLPFRQLEDLEIFGIASDAMILAEPQMLFGPKGVEHLFQNLHFMPNLKHVYVMYQEAWHNESLFLKECHYVCSFEIVVGMAHELSPQSAKLMPHSIRQIKEFVETHKHLQSKRVRYSTKVRNV